MMDYKSILQAHFSPHNYEWDRDNPGYRFLPYSHIQRQAKLLKRDTGLSYCAALNVVVQTLGYNSMQHYRSVVRSNKSDRLSKEEFVNVA